MCVCFLPGSCYPFKCSLPPFPPEALREEAGQARGKEEPASSVVKKHAALTWGPAVAASLS